MIYSLGIREAIEQREEALSPYAAKSRSSQGRMRPEEPCPVRTVFQQDRDRIIHSKAFRRLKHKTQVFIAPLGDHFVTRLTHTLEVSQIARTIARALNLNEDLVEAIALGHDLGHTPFGHIGEEVLNELYSQGFRHNEQSLRVVDVLERDGQGLNLTWEVRDGIVNHSKTRVDILGQGWGAAGTLEGEVCKIADTIAYINHDVGDAIRAGFIGESDLPNSTLSILGKSSSQRIDTLVCDIVSNSWAVTGKLVGQRLAIALSPEIREAANELRKFLFDRVYNSSQIRKEMGEAREIVRFLYVYFVNHGDRLPGEYTLRQEDVERNVVDYIAGMTDQYALRLTQQISPSRHRVSEILK